MYTYSLFPLQAFDIVLFSLNHMSMTVSHDIYHIRKLIVLSSSTTDAQPSCRADMPDRLTLCAPGRKGGPCPKGLTSADRAAAFARVAEKRQVTMAGFWGQPGLDKMTPQKKQDLPAFWSVRAHGQPFNDPRLTEGSSNHYKVASPPSLGASAPKPSGPATECLATLKSSLQNGFAMFHDDSQLTPRRLQPGTMNSLRE